MAELVAFIGEHCTGKMICMLLQKTLKIFITLKNKARGSGQVAQLVKAAF